MNSDVCMQLVGGDPQTVTGLTGLRASGESIAVIRQSFQAPEKRLQSIHEVNGLDGIMLALTATTRIVSRGRPHMCSTQQVFFEYCLNSE